jgi:hypothetical protein
MNSDDSRFIRPRTGGRIRRSKVVDTRAISAVMAVAAYQLPVTREYAPGMGMARLTAAVERDIVEISAEARRRAGAENVTLWGEVRFDYPHTDDPDLPWEVAHQQWNELMEKVFGGPSENRPDGERD